MEQGDAFTLTLAVETKWEKTADEGDADEGDKASPKEVARSKPAK